MSEKSHFVLLFGMSPTTLIAYSEIIFASCFLMSGPFKSALSAVHLVVIPSAYAYL